jgi:glycosyltransferase involved in cell wall biosynthesis
VDEGLTVVVATFGDHEWWQRGCRAIRSAIHQADAVVQVHECYGTLADARNEGLAAVDTEFVCFVDADDTIEPRYVEAMKRGMADVRAPMARRIYADRSEMWQPRVVNHEHDCTADCLTEGNWVLIGAAVRTNLIRAVGGWRPFTMYEDWDLFLRLHLVGASFELIRDAVYRVEVREDSRNNAGDSRKIYDEIRRANGLAPVFV